MTNIFKKFSSIENSYREKFIEKIEFAGLAKEFFHVEEKVHGANFQFNVSNDTIKAGARTHFVEEGDKFFNWKVVFDRHYDAITQMKAYYFPNNDIIVFGELYGGNYPHPDVPKGKYGMVQKEIFYSPDVNFICFDILVIDSVDVVEEVEYIKSHYINKLERDRLCEEHDIPYSKTLFRGTLYECLEQSNMFPTTISQRFGLPDIEGNTCEGVVIRPEDNICLPSGERPIIKNKNDKFTEKKVKVKVKTKLVLSEPVQKMVDNINQYINENRLDAMKSKIVGELNPKDFGLYIKMFSQDVFEDFFKDYSDEFKTWEKGDKKILQKQVNTLIIQFLKTNLLPKI